jgi:hypothetical protein
MAPNRESVEYTLEVDCVGSCQLFVSCDLIDCLYSEAIPVAAYIPGGVITARKPAGSPPSETPPIIKLFTGQYWNVQQHPEVLEIQIPHSLVIPVGGMPIGVWMAIYAWLCPRWIASHVLPFHAVAIGWKDRAILLAGRSGVGKSTLALRCMAEGGYFLTGNKSLISLDTFSLVGGTYAVTVRKDQENELLSVGHIPFKYNDRAAVLLSPPRDPVPVAGIVLPTLLSDDYASGGWSHAIEYPYSLHRLLPIATDVANSLIVLGDGDALVSGVSGSSTVNAVTRQFAEQLQRIPVHSVGGSITFGATVLQSLLEEW